MIAVVVTFRLGDTFDEQAIRRVAETARATFEGMPGLRSKAFTVNAGKRERVTGLYGVRPTVEFAHIATLVENGRA